MQSPQTPRPPGRGLSPRSHRRSFESDAGAACEGMARNPAARAGIQIAMILSLAFVESLVLFTLVVVFAKVVK